MALQDGGRLAAGRQVVVSPPPVMTQTQLTRDTNVPAGNSLKKHADSGCGLLAAEAHIIVNNQQDI
jgi:hypothetical protein